MKKLLVSLGLLILFSLFLSRPAFASPVAGASAQLKNDTNQKDERVEKLAFFLAGHNSPLSQFADCFVEAADKYGLDWKLLAAISGIESTFGKRIPANSFNAYGWGNGQIHFESWQQSIDHVSRILAEKYVAKGLDTPDKMAPIYAPPSDSWAGKVNYFMEKIDQACPLCLTL